MSSLIRNGLIGALILTACLGCISKKFNPSEQPDGLSPAFTTLPAGWNTVTPGGETGCSDGSDYAFYVRAGDPNKLLVYFQGGGACWNLETCDPLHKPTYTIAAGPSIPARYDGIFNYGRADNPFKDHTVIFAPYCSADVHLGQAQRSYQRTEAQKAKIRAERSSSEVIPDQFTIEHRGFANGNAVLAWTQRNVTAPASVFVTGSSAGSIPSPYYALRIARLYPSAEVVQLGDGSGGYRRINNAANPTLAWNTVEVLREDPAFTDLTSASFNFEQLYINAAVAAPEITFSAYDAAEDSVQKRFLTLGKINTPSLLEATSHNQQSIRNAVPEFRSYIAGGDSHTILARPEFYRFTVGERSVQDWVSQLAAGQVVDDVRCDPCDAAQSINRSEP